MYFTPASSPSRPWSWMCKNSTEEKKSKETSGRGPVGSLFQSGHRTQTHIVHASQRKPGLAHQPSATHWAPGRGVMLHNVVERTPVFFSFIFFCQCKILRMILSSLCLNADVLMCVWTHLNPPESDTHSSKADWLWLTWESFFFVEYSCKICSISPKKSILNAPSDRGCMHVTTSDSWRISSAVSPAVTTLRRPVRHKPRACTALSEAVRSGCSSLEHPVASGPRGGEQPSVYMYSQHKFKASIHHLYNKVF